jgi:hypothetical protein
MQRLEAIDRFCIQNNGKEVSACRSCYQEVMRVLLSRNVKDVNVLVDSHAAGAVMELFSEISP